MSDETGSARTPGGPDDAIGRLIERAGPRPAVPAERLARLEMAVHAHWRRTVRRDRRRGLMVVIGLPLASAAAIAALVGIGYWMHGGPLGAGAPAATVVRAEGRVLRLDGRGIEAGGLLEMGAGLRTGPDGRVAMRTLDGVAVRVDSNSEVRLLEGQVLELERGAVYADTEGSDRLHAIEIRTRLGTITDVGTRFEVRLAAEGLRLDVRTGVASLTRGGQTSSASAGTRLRVDPGGVIETGEVPIDDSDWDWVQDIAPPFGLEGRNLGDYLDWLTHETGWRVSFADPSIAASARTIVLHGSASGLRPGDTLDAVLPACGLRYRLEHGSLVIDRAGPGR
jgi:ferric-dicitrate binding protein FerR (iron transport regulator)